MDFYDYFGKDMPFVVIEGRQSKKGYIFVFSTNFEKIIHPLALKRQIIVRLLLIDENNQILKEKLISISKFRLLQLKRNLHAYFDFNALIDTIELNLKSNSIKWLDRIKTISLQEPLTFSDAQAMQYKTTTMMHHPEIVRTLETYRKSPHYDLLEGLNAVIYDAVGGMAIYQFGRGFENEIGLDMDLTGSFLFALTSLFYNEPKKKFDTINVSDIAHKNELTILLHRIKNYFVIGLYNPQIRLQFKKSPDQCINILRELLLSLPEEIGNALNISDANVKKRTCTHCEKTEFTKRARNNYTCDNCGLTVEVEDLDLEDCFEIDNAGEFIRFYVENFEDWFREKYNVECTYFKIDQKELIFRVETSYLLSLKWALALKETFEKFDLVEKFVIDPSQFYGSKFIATFKKELDQYP